MDSILVAHFGAGRVRAFTHEPKSDDRVAVGALGANRFPIDDIDLVLFEPHQLEALWAAADLR